MSGTPSSLPSPRADEAARAGAPAVGEKRRNGPRTQVLDTAKIVFGDSTLDCLVTSLSKSGVSVRTGTVVPVPERVRLTFSNGTEVSARRRWVRGLAIGFALDQA